MPKKGKGRLICPVQTGRRKKRDVQGYEGPRVWGSWVSDLVDSGQVSKVETILDAMDWPQLIIFHYDGSDRVVAPFVVGVSSRGNPLCVVIRLEGVSRSGKGPGWRVFQVEKMENVENHQEFFEPDDFDFQEFYPWTYKVLKML